MPKVQRHHVVAVATFQGVVSIIVPWMMAVMIRKLIGVALMGPSGPSSAPSQGIFRVVFLDEFSFQVALGFVVMAALIMAFGNAFMSFLAQKRSEDTGFTIRRQILQCVTSSRDGGDTSTDIHRAATDMIVNVKLVQDFQAYDESFLIVYNVMLIFSLLLLFFFTWYGALVAIAVLFTSEAWCAMVERFRKSVYTQVQQNTHRLNSRLLDVIKNGTVIKIMGTVSQEQEALRGIERTAERARQVDARYRLIRDAVRLSLNVLVAPIMAFIGWHMIQQAETGIEALDESCAVLVSVVLLDQVHKALAALFYIHDRQLGAQKAKQAIDDFLACNSSVRRDDDTEVETERNEDDLSSEGESNCDIETGEKSAMTEVVGDPKNNTKTNAVYFHDITLNYPGREVPVLGHYSQQLEKGRIHGLVGESGSGKSTLLKILAKLMTPDSGSLSLWDNVRIAYVSQDQKIFCRTIRENVSHSTSKFSDEDIWKALRQAELYDWVQSLPDGLDTLLEDGESMVSGGQLQRLHLAHLFCTGKDADLVMLDEVLSAVDHANREILITRLESFLKGKTAVIITHHSEMLRICDEVHDMVSVKLANAVAVKAAQECGPTLPAYASTVFASGLSVVPKADQSIPMFSSIEIEV